MMLLLRLIFVLLKSKYHRIDDPLEETTLNMRVWFNDLDPAMHMNNGRYLTVMDLGRMDHITRLGLLKPVISNRWQPLVGGSTFRFKKSLGMLASYQLVTKLVCWDEKWAYYEQRFEKNGRLYGIVLVRVLMRGRNGNVPIDDLMARLDYDKKSPEMPPEIKSWIKWLEN